MKRFDLIEGLKANREVVIEKYNKLAQDENFDGITLKAFMNEVVRICQMNRISSEKMLVNKLPLFLGNIYVQHSRIIAYDAVTEDLKRKYQGTSFMAMV